MRRRHRIVCAVLLASILVWAAGSVQAAGYGLYVNGRQVTGAQTYLAGGQLMVRGVDLARALGIQIRWDAADKRIDLTRGSTRVAYWLHSRTVFRNGTRLQAPVATANRNGWVYLPAWQAAALFGGKVSWDGSSMYIVDPAAPGGAAAAVPDQPAHPLESRHFIFPFAPGVRYQPYGDTYGDARSWSPGGAVSRRHEGIDILAPKGTPLVAVGDGVIHRLGWNQYGGWRITFKLDKAPYLAYYAHLSGYAKGMAVGVRVRRGQVLGYVGSTGYGPVGTDDQMVPHLHFGLYHQTSGEPINPYPFLKLWESRR